MTVRLLPVEPQPADPAVDVIFIHGLDGDPYETWRHAENEDSWLNWLAEEHPTVAIHSLAYDAWSTRWRGSSMSLQDRGINVLTLLESHEIGRNPTVFICHSLGGLIAKQLLFHGNAVRSTSSSVTESIVGIAFLATPHTGSSLARVADALRVIYRPTSAVRDLEDNDAYLRMLNTWYRSNAGARNIRTLALTETQSTRGTLVVDQKSADPGLPGVDAVPIDANHLDICKPRSRDELVYLAVSRFIRSLSAAPLATTPAETPEVEKSVIREIDSSPGRISENFQAQGLLDKARLWLLRDQIPDSGAWGLSQAVMQQNLLGRVSTQLEVREGGFISTLVALRALSSYEVSRETFRSRPYAWQASRYIVDRQISDGSFGRFVESRSGLEIHPSVRHTAFAASSLLLLDASSSAVLDAIAFLNRATSLAGDHWWSREAAPSLALAGVLHLDRQLALLDAEDLDVDDVPELMTAESRRTARRSLVNVATTQFAPFWPPYGRTLGMLYATALTTIELLPVPVPKSLRSTVVRIMSTILSRSVGGGIPYGPEQTYPDLGMSVFALHILLSRVLGDPDVRDTGDGATLSAYIAPLVTFISEHWDDPEARRFTYCDTLPYVLRLGTAL